MTPFIADHSAVRSLEPVAWAGLFASLAATAVGWAPGRPVAFAAIGPAEVVAWAQAIGQTIGILAAAANGLAILAHRWGRKPRRPRKPPARKPKAEVKPACG
jgi:hypothetical protein